MEISNWSQKGLICNNGKMKIKIVFVIE